jgi:hypothetical protein
VINEKWIVCLYILDGFLAFIGLVTCINILSFFCNEQSEALRKFLNSFAIVSLFVAVMTFFLGAFFLMVGVFSYDMAEVMRDFIFSSQNLLNNHTLISNPVVARYFDTCLTSGKLGEDEFGLKEGIGKVITDLYDDSFSLTSIQVLLSKSWHSMAVNDLNLYYYTAIKDLSMTMARNSSSPISKNSEISEVLNKLNSFSNSSCSSDIWVSDPILCPRDFQLPIPGDIATSNTTQEKFIKQRTFSCLIIKDWDEEAISKRYSLQCDSEITQNIILYHSSLKKYFFQNRDILNALLASNDSIDKNYTKIGKYVKNSLNNIRNITNPLVQVLQTTLGSSGFSYLFNCKFMKEALDILYYHLQYSLYSNLNKLAAVCITCGLLQSINIYLVIFLTNRFSKDDMRASYDSVSASVRYE